MTKSDEQYEEPPFDRLWMDVTANRSCAFLDFEEALGFVEGQLREDHVAVIREHIEECSFCAQEITAIERMHSASYLADTLRLEATREDSGHIPDKASKQSISTLLEQSPSVPVIALPTEEEMDFLKILWDEESNSPLPFEQLAQRVERSSCRNLSFPDIARQFQRMREGGYVDYVDVSASTAGVRAGAESGTSAKTFCPSFGRVEFFVNSWRHFVNKNLDVEAIANICAYADALGISGGDRSLIASWLQDRV